MKNFSEEYLRTIDVHTILPQQEPFIMVGKLTYFETSTATTETLICPDNIFVDNGYFSATGMLENIAQTSAAKTGFYKFYVLHEEVCVGFIGAVKNYEIYSLAPVGAIITTKIDVIQEVLGMTLAQAEVRCGDKVLARAEMKLSHAE